MLPVTWLVVRLYVCFAHDRFFVPPTEKQLQMTGRLWRHGLTMMPHMIAGVGGPSEEQHARHTGRAVFCLRIEHAPSIMSPGLSDRDVVI